MSRDTIVAIIAKFNLNEDFNFALNISSDLNNEM